MLPVIVKDLRRFALPLALWLGLLVAGTVWLRFTSLPVNAPLEVAGATAESYGAFAVVLTGLQLLLAYVLVGLVVLEDSVVGTTSFWLTRPLSGWRLLGAKLGTLVAAFVVIPGVLLSVVWLAVGFSRHQWAVDVMEFAALQSAVVVIAAAVASLTRNAGNFLVASLALAVAFVLCVGYFVTRHWAEPQTWELRETRGWLTQILAVLGLGVILLHQFATRRTGRAWVLVGCGLVGLFAVRVAWPWPLWSQLVGYLDHRVPVSPTELTIAAKTLRPNRDGGLVLTTPAPAADGQLLAPRTFTWRGANPSDDAPELTATAASAWGEDAARSALRVGTVSGLRWPLSANWGAYHRRRDALAGRADVTVAVAVAHVVAELPVRAGASAADGAARLRVLHVSWQPGDSVEVVLEEEVVAPVLELLAPIDGAARREALHGAPAAIDLYALVDRSAGTVRLLKPYHAGDAVLNGIGRGVTRLTLPPPAVTAADSSGAALERMTIAKVRLQRTGFASVALPVDGVTVDEGGTR